MPGRPITRAKNEVKLMNGETTATETPLQPKTGDEKPVPGRKKTLDKWNSRERMLELVRIREEKRARGEIEMGPPRTKFSKREREDAALERLMPKALKVLQEQLDDDDPRIRQSAAIKVIEYRKGRPTQMIKQEVQGVTAIRFETAALSGALLPPPLPPDVIEGEAIEDADTDAD